MYDSIPFNTTPGKIHLHCRITNAVIRGDMDGGSFTIKVTDVEVLLRVFTHLLSGTSAECSTTLRGRVSGSLLRDLKRFSFCVIPNCMRLENCETTEENLYIH
ncbi:hypothetical protein Bbelb_348890 [Branchiostoma belcheri]|nr:hypothetical protein Bbelb_348890 [Branchiostoma belcheri]